MSTNFYLRKKISEEQKEYMKSLIDQEKFDELCDEIPQDIHIGKRSCGWKFLWNANRFEYFKPTIESLHEFLKSGDIYDEYGVKFTFEDFMNDEAGPSIDNGIDGIDWFNKHPEEYRYIRDSTNTEFFEKNYNIDVNRACEFYIGKYRFTAWDDFC